MKKVKIIAIISGVLTAAQLLPAFMSVVWLAQFRSKDAGAIGIIGGADGPTAIYTVAVAELPILIIARYVFFAACVLTFIVSTALLIRHRNKRQ